MSRNRTIRILRPGRLNRLLAGAAILAMLCGGALAQNGRGHAAMQRGWPGPRQQPQRPNVAARPAQNYGARPGPAPRQAAPIQRVPESQPHAAPIQRMPPPGQPQGYSQGYSQNNEARPMMRAAPSGQLITPNRPGQTQQHLAGWMQQHSNMPLAEQQRALASEPGFRNLPAQEQQQLHNRLTQLNNMSPQQRQRVEQRTEDMERLAPAQRQQVRGAMAAVGSLPDERRHAVARAFYQLRDLPPGQRQAYMNSPQFRGQYNDQERGAINGLLNVAPIYPPLQGQQPR